MKILIAYASKSGTCRAAATMLRDLLKSHTVTLFDLAEGFPDPAEFDYAVVGGPVRFGRAHKALRGFIKEKGEALASRPHTFFLCCAFPDAFDDYTVRTFPAPLLESADGTLYFGGEMKVENQKGLDKLFAKAVRASVRESEDADTMLPGLLPEHIRLLADRLCGRN